MSRDCPVSSRPSLTGTANSGHACPVIPKTPWAAARLKALLAEAGMSQETLADQVGIRRETIVKLANANRAMTPYYAEKIAPTLGVKPEDLLEPDAPEAPPDPLHRLEAVEEGLNKLGPELMNLNDLAARVQALEQRAPRGKQPVDPQRKQ